MKDPVYRSYWLGGLADNCGWQMQIVGASWIMTLLDGRASMVALVQTSFALPLVLLSLPGGTLSDLFGKRRIVLAAQMFLMLMAAVLALLTWTGALTPLLLLALTFLLGSGRAVYYPGWQALIFQIVPRERAAPAVALSAITMQVARSGGPGLAGVFVASVGAFSTFVLSGTGNLIVALVARRLPKDRPTAINTGSAAALSEGLRLFARSSVLQALALRSFFFNMATCSLIALLPLLVREDLGGGPQVYGLLLGALGLGGALGALLTAGASATAGLERYLLPRLVGFGLCTFGIAYGGSLPVVAVALCGAGACWIMGQVRLNATFQISAPPEALSRLIALYLMAAYAGIALGSLLWGLVADIFGTSQALVWSGGMTALLPLLHFVRPAGEV